MSALSASSMSIWTLCYENECGHIWMMLNFGTECLLLSLIVVTSVWKTLQGSGSLKLWLMQEACKLLKYSIFQIFQNASKVASAKILFESPLPVNNNNRIYNSHYFTLAKMGISWNYIIFLICKVVMHALISSLFSLILDNCSRVVKKFLKSQITTSLSRTFWAATYVILQLFNANDWRPSNDLCIQNFLRIIMRVWKKIIQWKGFLKLWILKLFFLTLVHFVLFF